MLRSVLPPMYLASGATSATNSCMHSFRSPLHRRIASPRSLEMGVLDSTDISAVVARASEAVSSGSEDTLRASSAVPEAAVVSTAWVSGDDSGAEALGTVV